MLKKVFLIIIIFLIYPLNLSANEKNLIIAQLLEVNNFNFDFEQASNEKKETGNCILVFDSQLKCNYNDDKQKEKPPINQVVSTHCISHIAVVADQNNAKDAQNIRGNR